MISISTRLDTTRLDRLLATLPRAVEELVEASCRRVEHTAKLVVPVRTGATQRSIHCEPFDNVSGLFPPSGWRGRGEFVGHIGPTTPWSLFLEFGTCKMSARPFITPAIEQERARFIRAVQTLAGGSW